MCAELAPRPPSSAGEAATRAADRVRTIRRARWVFFAVFGAPILLAILGSFGLIATDGAGGGGVLSFIVLAVAALAGAALPFLVVALVGGAVLVAVWGRLRQGERTDLDMARQSGESGPRRGFALAERLRADPEVAAALAGLEFQRGAAAAGVARRRILFMAAALALGAAFAWWILSSPPSPKNPHPFLGAAAAIICLLGGALALAELSPAARAYNAAFKRALAPHLLARFGAFEIAPAGGSGAAGLAAAADLLPTLAPDRFRVEDEILGLHRGRTTRIVEYRMFGRDRRGRIDRDSSACAGIVVTTTAARPWSGRLVLLGPVSGGEVWPAQIDLDRVHLEDPEFEAIYRVYASDQIFARAVLTPRMMQALPATAADGDFLPPLLAINGERVALFAPFLVASTRFLEADATEANVLEQAALQLESLARVFDFVDMLFENQRLHMTSPGTGDMPP